MAEYQQIKKSESKEAADAVYKQAVEEGKIIVKDVICDAFLQESLLHPEDHSVIATMRDPEKLNRYWVAPGTPGYAHRLGGLEKDFTTGAISTDPKNHQKMVDVRQAKINKVADYIPELEVYGDASADTLIVGWGGTCGHLRSATDKLNETGKKAALAHFNYIMPLPKNTRDVLSKYKKIVVCELNGGQFASYLRSQFPEISISQFNKVQGQPFEVHEMLLFIRCSQASTDKTMFFDYSRIRQITKELLFGRHLYLIPDHIQIALNLRISISDFGSQLLSFLH